MEKFQKTQLDFFKTQLDFFKTQDFFQNSGQNFIKTQINKKSKGTYCSAILKGLPTRCTEF